MSLPVRKIFTFLCVIFCAWFFIRFALPVLLPFLLGGMLAALSEPAAKKLTKLHVPRSVSAAIAVTMTLGVLAVLVLALAATALRQLSRLAGVLPDMASMAMSGIEELQHWLLGLTLRLPDGVSVPIQNAILNFSRGGAALLEQAVRYVLGLAGGVLCAIPGSALSIATGLIAAYMICSEGPGLRRLLLEKIPRQEQEKWKQKLHFLRKNGAMWLLSQAKLTGVTFCILAAGLLFLRIPFWLGWAAAICLVDAFPVLGIGTILMPWSLICLLQADTARAAGLLGLYVTAALVRSVLEPKFVGNHLGLDPLLTLLALYGGFRLWGITGMMVMPVVCVGMVTFMQDGV